MSAIAPWEAPPGGDEHDELGRPFRVVAKLRNNRLIRAREQLGYQTAAAAATAIGISYRVLVDYEALRDSPWNAKSGQWKESATKIAAAYAYHPEELWPDVIRSVRDTTATLELSGPSMVVGDDYDFKELQAQVRKVLATLTPREQKVLEMRFGLGQEACTCQRCQERPEDGGAHTLEDVGQKLRVQKTRIQQIEAKALRKLRHPSKAKRFQSFVDPDEWTTKPAVRGRCSRCGRILRLGEHDRCWACNRKET